MTKATVFVVLTFLLSWPLAFCCFALGMEPYSAPWFVVAVFFMFTPMLSAVVVQKWVYRQELLGPMGVSFRFNRWFLVALFLPAALAIASAVVSPLFANTSFTLEPREANIFEFFAVSLPQERVEALSRSVHELPFHPFLLVLVGGTLAGLTVNGLAGFGEEYGWRGLFLRETGRLGFWRSTCLIGVIWGIWHLPFIVHGFNYPEHPVAGVFMMALWTTLFSPVISYVRIRSGSVLSAAIMHGAINGTAIAPALVLKGGDSLHVGVMGWPGIVILVLFNAAILVSGRPGDWHERWMKRMSEGAARP